MSSSDDAIRQRMPKRRKPPLSPIHVTHTTRITPNLQRIAFEGEVLRRFEPDNTGGYIKFGFDTAGSPVDPTRGDTPEDVRLRTYTIRHIDAENGLIWVDFVLHGDGGVDDGPASAFARRAVVGDCIGIAGPGGVKALAPEADAYIIAGDMTALPAIAAKLEQRCALPGAISGHLVVELLHADDAQCLDVPEGLTLHTVINPNPAENGSALIECLRALPWPEGRVFAWCAAEFSRMRDFRAWVRDEQGIDLQHRYVSSYWMLGRTEEGHKQEKRRDADADAA